MSAEIFRIAESELDRMLAVARPLLERRGISVADGSARQALVWATSFTYERQLRDTKQRVAATLTLNGDAPPILQTIAVSGAITERDQKTLAWPELRQRGLADIIEKKLAEQQIGLQTRIGINYAHLELIRRCDVLRDLVTDDVPHAAELRDRIATWRSEAEARTLFLPSRKTLIDEFRYGHINDDLVSHNDFYANSIYSPSMPGLPKPVADLPVIAPTPAPNVTRTAIQSVMNRFDAPRPDPPSRALGISLVLFSLLILGAGVWLRNWLTVAGGVGFLVVAIGAMFR